MTQENGYLEPYLTPTELTALMLYADGMNGQQAAEEMGYSSRSAFWAIMVDVREKFGAKTNPHTIALAYHYGFLKPKVTEGH